MTLGVSPSGPGYSAKPEPVPVSAAVAASIPDAARERPSAHGLILGRALARIAENGREQQPDLPEMCATCAFRPGCMTSMMAATGSEALNCLLGVDDAGFACHHGMIDGEPTKLCAGFAAAKAASFDFVKREISAVHEALDRLPDPDPIRAEFDEWIARVDPESEMDDYQRGRAFLRARSAK